MVRKYSTKSSSCRWPLQVFFNILDLDGINAGYCIKKPQEKKYPEKTFCFNWQPNFLQKMRVHGNNKILRIYSTALKNHMKTTNRRTVVWDKIRTTQI